MTQRAEDRRLARVTKICLALPEASRNVTGRHAAFVVRKKTFASYLDDHYGDGIVAAFSKSRLERTRILPGLIPIGSTWRLTSDRELSLVRE